jgi:integrase
VSKTLHIKFSDAEIRRQAEEGARNLRDPRYPALMFRFNAGRARGSWLVVRHAGKSTARKMGNWPDLTCSAAIALLPKKLAELTADPTAVVATSGWSTVGDVLRWFDERTARARSLSSKRKSTVRSLIARHLLPCVGSLRLAAVDRETLDERLIWPMQENNSLAYTRQAFGLLKLALKQAATLRRLANNPLADVVFTDFIKTPIRPKGSRLRPQQLPEILQALGYLWEARPSEAMLPLMMLCHGTRISETRLSKWQNITLCNDGEWFIPAADTKTDADHRLPLTRQAIAMLSAYRARQIASGYSGAYLFPRGDGTPLSASQAGSIFARISDGEWSSHDLRKVARSMWADLGVDYLIGELLLNHALDDLDAAYIHTHAMGLKRDALERWHTWLQVRGLSFFATGTEPGRAVEPTALQANNHAAPSAA